MDWANKRAKIDAAFKEDVSTDLSLFEDPSVRDSKIEELRAVIGREFQDIGLPAKNDMKVRTELRTKLMANPRHAAIGNNDISVFDELLEEVVGFGVLERISRNEDVTDVTFNGHELIIETNKEKKINETNGLVDATYIQRLVTGFATASGGSSKDFNESKPILDLVVGNMRLNAVHGSSAQDGITMAVRLSRPRLIVTTEVIGQMAPPAIGELLKAFVKAQCNIVIAGKTGTGKALSNDTLIPTPLGLIKNGNLAVGDLVFAGDGSITTIKGVYPQGKKAAYKVRFQDGREVICNDEHLWTVLTRDGEYETLTLKDIKSRMEQGQIMCVPIAPAVDFEPEALDVSEWSESYAKLMGQRINSKIEFSSLEKVQFMSQNIRHTFIQSVFDTIGEVTSEFGREAFAKFNHLDIANLVANVMRSVGYVVIVNGNVNSDLPYELTILDDSRVNDDFVKDLKRKLFDKEYRQPAAPALEGLLILDIEDLHRDLEMTCIEVEHPDHTYLANDYVVTHNTEVTKYLISEIPFREKVVLIEDVAEMHAKELFPNLDIHSWVVAGEATASNLLKASLRNNPEWVIVTELRTGEEAIEWLEAIKSDHRSITSLHAASTLDIPSRIQGMYSEMRNVDSDKFEQTVFKLLNVGIQIEAKIINDKKVRFISEVMEFREDKDGGPILLFKQNRNNLGVPRYKWADISEDMRDRLIDAGANFKQFDAAYANYLKSDAVLKKQQLKMKQRIAEKSTELLVEHEANKNVENHLAKNGQK